MSRKNKGPKAALSAPPNTQEFSMSDAVGIVQLIENTPQQMTIVGARQVDALLNRFKLFANKHLAPKPAQEQPAEDPLEDGKPTQA